MRDVNHVDVSHHLEQFAGHVLRCPDAGRRIIDLAGISPGVPDEFGDRLGWKGRMHLHAVALMADADDRRHVTREIIFEMLVERGVDRVLQARHQQRVAVGRRIHHRLRSDVSAGAGPVLDDELLAEPFGQPLCH